MATSLPCIDMPSYGVGAAILSATTSGVAPMTSLSVFGETVSQASRPTVQPLTGSSQVSALLNSLYTTLTPQSATPSSINSVIYSDQSMIGDSTTTGYLSKFDSTSQSYNVRASTEVDATSSSSSIPTSSLSHSITSGPDLSSTHSQGLASTTPSTYTVTVGGHDSSSFSPQTVDANVGDQILFQFLGKNHTLTQSSFDFPCRPKGRFDSGFGFYNPLDQLASPEQQLLYLVRDSDPTWFFCRQSLPYSHCNRGMVFAINSGDLWHQFLQNAMAQPGSSGIVATGSLYGKATTRQLLPSGSLGTLATSQTALPAIANGQACLLPLSSAAVALACFILVL